MRLVTAVAALLRRLRVERGVVALVFAVVAITSFGVAAGPRLFNQVADEALRYEATHATAVHLVRASAPGNTAMLMVLSKQREDRSR